MNPWKQGRLQIYASRITDCGSSMGAQQQMAEDQSGKRDKPKLTRKELDRIEAEMIMRPFVRREYAGDPQQPRRFWVRTRNKA